MPSTVLIKPVKKRLDILLVEKNFAESRAKAQALIMAGQVRANGEIARHSGKIFPFETQLSVIAPMPFVSRGGQKLQAALIRFGVSGSGRICLDVGASTGGFTDCLLQNGAEKVYAVDVGRGQLDAKLRGDPRVELFEKQNIRHFPHELKPRPDFACVDVSFISLANVLPKICEMTGENAEILALVKPNFEVGPHLAPKGVVRDEKIRRSAVEKVVKFSSLLGLKFQGSMESPLKGPKGNVEYFVHLQK